LSWLMDLKDEDRSVEGIAVVGALGGVQILPQNGLFGRAQDLLSTALSDKDNAAQVDESGDRWARLARFIATCWPITIGVEANRFSFTIPEDIRKLELVPSYGGQSVVFAAGEILEVWRASDWLQRSRRSGSRLRVLFEQATEELKLRG
jgi:hypothetical protein